MKFHSTFVFIVGLALYSTTTYPGVGGALDSAEFQISGKVLGISHPTGYPIYHLITYCISWIPIGTLAVRVTFFSVVCASLSAAFLMEVLIRCTANRLFCYMAIAFFMGSQAYWHNATVSEVYAFQYCLHSAAILFYLRWKHSRRSRWFIIGAAVLGIGFAHHLMTVFLAAGIVAAIVVDPQTPRLSFSDLIKSLAAFCIPLCAFLYFPIRAMLGAPSFDFYTFSSIADLIQYILGGNNTHLLRQDVFWILNHSLMEGVVYLIRFTGVFSVFLIVIGAFCWIENGKPEAILFLGLLLVHVFLTGLWTEADREAIVVPALMMGTILMSVGAQVLSSALDRWLPQFFTGKACVVGGLCLTLLLIVNQSWREIGVRNRETLDLRYRSMYEAIPDKAIVLSPYWEETNIMKYMAWSGEFPDKDVRVYRWNDPRSRSGIETVLSYIQGQGAIGFPSIDPGDRRPVVFLHPLEEQYQTPLLALQPIPAGENLFIFQATLASQLTKATENYIPLSQLPWEPMAWEWSEPRHNFTINGNPLSIGKTTYQEGYGVHGGTEIRIPVPKGATRFSVIVGAAGDLPPDAATTFAVLIHSQNILLKRSPVLTVLSEPYTLECRLDGETELSLEVWGTEDGLKSDHAVLGEPRFYFD